MKTKILGTGLTGLVGSRIAELLSEKYDFENLGSDTGVNITDKEAVLKRIRSSPASIILHLAAKTDVDGCEKDKTLQESGDAWRINVEGTRNIIEAAKSADKPIIYISTDFVFDGTQDSYKEEDKQNPINWYGVTKYEGEKIVQNSGLPFLICRIAFPYRAIFDSKKDLIRTILEKLKNGEKLSMVHDQVITPTFIDDIAMALDLLIEKRAGGIYHVVGSSSHSPKDIAYLIARAFSLNQSLIGQISKEHYYAGRAPRPFSLFLKNDKLTQLGIKMSTLEEGLERVKSQIEDSI